MVPPPRDFRRKTLKPRHRPLVYSMAEAMFAHENGPKPERLDEFVDELDSFVSFASRTLRMTLMLMLEVVRFAPVLLVYRWATFPTLSREDRVCVLERMEHSRLYIVLTLVFAAYKAIFSLLFFEAPQELTVSGYSSDRQRHLNLHKPAPAAAE